MITEKTVTQATITFKEIFDLLVKEYPTRFNGMQQLQIEVEIPRPYDIDDPIGVQKTKFEKVTIDHKVVIVATSVPEQVVD